MFGSTPLRPTGLATADQGLANVVELLEWCAALVGDTLDGHQDLSHAAPADRELLGAAAGHPGRRWPTCSTARTRIPDLDRLEQARTASAAHQPQLTGDPDRLRRAAAHAAHAQVDRGRGAGRASPGRAASPPGAAEPGADRGRAPPLVRPARPELGQRAARADQRHRVSWPGTPASGRSGSATACAARSALAIAVAVADLSGVQHGFWVVAGHPVGTADQRGRDRGHRAARAGRHGHRLRVGAALLIGIGTGPDRAVGGPAVRRLRGRLRAGHHAVRRRPGGVHDHRRGDLQPAGARRAGRSGCCGSRTWPSAAAVSVVVGLLFWPRGAAGLVGNDLADAFRRGGSYLAAGRGLGAGRCGRRRRTRRSPPSRAGIRLDEALARLPDRAGHQATDQARPVGPGPGRDPAAAHRLLGGQPARADRPGRADHGAGGRPGGDSTPGSPISQGPGRQPSPVASPPAIPAAWTGTARSSST